MRNRRKYRVSLTRITGEIETRERKTVSVHAQTKEDASAQAFAHATETDPGSPWRVDVIVPICGSLQFSG